MCLVYLYFVLCVWGCSSVKLVNIPHLHGVQYIEALWIRILDVLLCYKSVNPPSIIPGTVHSFPLPLFARL